MFGKMKRELTQPLDELAQRDEEEALSVIYEKPYQDLAAQEKHLGITHRFSRHRGNKRFLLTRDGGFAVRTRHPHYTCLPAGISAVFQPWNLAGGSCVAVNLPEQFRWPNDYGISAWVKSIDLREIYRLTQCTKQLTSEERDRVVKVPPWHHWSSTSEDKVVAKRVGNCIEVWSTGFAGWEKIDFALLGQSAF